MIRMFSMLLFVLALTAGAAGAQDGRKDAGGPGNSTVNLNTASVSQLEALPGIGKATAERIVEYRQKNGGFKRIEDLMNVRGIGEKSFLNLKPLITVTAAKGQS